MGGSDFGAVMAFAFRVLFVAAVALGAALVGAIWLLSYLIG